MKITLRNLQKRVPIHPSEIRKTALRALSGAPKDMPGEITISFVNDRFIKKLNLRYLGKDEPTDVLAFGGSNADIIISSDAAVRNAKAFKTNPPYELNLYVVHGILHLLGHDDRTENQRALMQKKAERVLSKLKWVSTKQKRSS